MDRYEYYLICMVVNAVFAIIPALIARYKGRSTFGYWIFGYFAFWPALVVSICVRNLTDIQARRAEELNSSPLMRASRDEYARKQVVNAIYDNGWTCNRCFMNNMSSVNYCECGLSRGESAKMGSFK